MVHFIFSLIMALAHADDSASHAPRLSHDLSGTTNMIESGHCTLGLQVAGCGISPRWSLGTSPWLAQDYNMINVQSRFTLKQLDDGDRYTFELVYFKTVGRRVFTATDSNGQSYQYTNHNYDMEAVWLMWIRSFKFEPHYTLHVNFHTNYYFNDKMPLSLRRPIPGRSKFQFNLTALNEVDLTAGWFVLGELGLLDFTQPILELQGGASIGRVTQHWEWHVGFSLTGTPEALFSPVSRQDYQQDLRYDPRGYDQNLDRDRARLDYGLHPEFSLQYYF